MSSFDFIVDNIRYSYSSLSSFENCKYGWKLTYIDVMPRVSNFFAEYGLLIHECNEKYFRGELDSFELSSYYLNNYDKFVKSYPPEYPAGMAERYKTAGLEFYDNFSFNRYEYDIINVESKLDFELAPNIIFTARPDLVLRSKETGKVALYDYKSSAPFRIDKYSGLEKTDTKKLEGYYKQMFLYTYALRKVKDISLDEITLWFTRPSRFVTIPWDEEKEKKAVDWALKIIKRIKTTENFEYNNSNKYFCDNLCGVRDFCEYR